MDSVLALLAHAYVPLQFWLYVFQHAVRLINILPSSSFQNSSPFLTLHNKESDLNSLKIFCLACWPLTKPFNQHKFGYRALECAYFGHSSSHKGSICYHILSHRVYISKDVKHNEDHFPFSFLLKSNTPNEPTHVTLPLLKSIEIFLPYSQSIPSPIPIPTSLSTLPSQTEHSLPDAQQHS